MISQVRSQEDVQPAVLPSETDASQPTESTKTKGQSEESRDEKSNRKGEAKGKKKKGKKDKKKKNKKRERFEIRDTSLGLGLFAGRRFRADKLIGEVHGELIHDPDYSSAYGIDLGDDYTLEPAEPFRFLNHSCDPNCELIWIEPDHHDDAPASIVVSSIRSVEPGEQLTIDYAWPASGAIRCGCGSPKCRGWVVDEAELDELTEVAVGVE